MSSRDTYFEVVRRLSRGRTVWSGRDNFIGIRANGFKGPKMYLNKGFQGYFESPMDPRSFESHMSAYTSIHDKCCDVNGLICV